MYKNYLRNKRGLELCSRRTNGKHLKSIPNNNVPSPDTVLRGIQELTTENTIYTSDSGKSYNFNINTKLNRLNIRSLKQTKELETDQSVFLGSTNL